MIGGWGVLRRHAFGFFFRAWLESFNFNFNSYFFDIGVGCFLSLHYGGHFSFLFLYSSVLFDAPNTR